MPILKQEKYTWVILNVKQENGIFLKCSRTVTHFKTVVHICVNQLPWGWVMWTLQVVFQDNPGTAYNF